MEPCHCGGLCDEDRVGSGSAQRPSDGTLYCLPLLIGHEWMKACNSPAWPSRQRSSSAAWQLNPVMAATRVAARLSGFFGGVCLDNSQPDQVLTGVTSADGRVGATVWPRLTVTSPLNRGFRETVLRLKCPWLRVFARFSDVTNMSPRSESARIGAGDPYQVRSFCG